MIHFESFKTQQKLDTGWAEFFLPLSSIQTDAIQIHTPRPLHGSIRGRSIIEFGYQTNEFSLYNLPILTPFLRIHSWDSTTGRLELETDPSTSTKIVAIQKHLVTMLGSRKEWVSDPTNIQHDFQYMIHNSILTVYLHGSNPNQSHTGHVWVWSGSQWKQGVGPTSIRNGQMIRLAIRFQGIVSLPSDGTRTRYRIQHQTVALYHRPMSK